MLYNTRRKSFSFPALSIHLPVAHASRAAARLSPPSASPNSENPPSEKLERSHEESPSMSPPPKRTPLKYENTPPPSPEAETDDLEAEVKPREIDLEGINDEIVEGVIVLLQKTGNKPHLVKELAAILSQSVKIVKQSANPSRIISSRLSSYLKRPWTALTPCPVYTSSQKQLSRHQFQAQPPDLTKPTQNEEESFLRHPKSTSSPLYSKTMT
ncbi:hypothetical protein IFR05_014110 [Cadophora sp. M221]|nr:hypothetical protein IFR05_014110 [Cadophora sp. M221]